ncbi:MAG: thiol:disulfide interchange protein DsbA/DsbL [Pseudomonadales bacterium]|nr:thiol:disulfide interchange protein DsbA/DsbL [Pseudomonadales bacterium]
MKQFLGFKQLIAALLCSVFLMPAYAVERFVAGDHYLVVGDVNAPKPAKPAVLEFFSYGCPHCEQLEPALLEWKQKHGDGITFSRVPAQWNAYFKSLGQLYLTLEAMGVADKHSGKVFKYIHKQKKPLRKKAQIFAFVEKQLGIPKSEFEKAWDSKAVKEKLTDAGTKLRQFKVSGVPALLVNERYYVSVKTAGSEEGLFEIVDFLLQK